MMLGLETLPAHLVTADYLSRRFAKGGGSRADTPATCSTGMPELWEPGEILDVDSACESVRSFGA